METLIIYNSVHRMSTGKVAEAMAEAIGARLVKVADARPEELAGYGLIGFGSGIFNKKHHRALIEFIEKMPPMNKDVFIFSNSGTFRDLHHDLVKEKLSKKGCKIVAEFWCPGDFQPFGFNANMTGVLAYVGGQNKGHPDAKDLDNARTFAKSLVKIVFHGN